MMQYVSRMRLIFVISSFLRRKDTKFSVPEAYRERKLLNKCLFAKLPLKVVCVSLKVVL